MIEDISQEDLSLSVSTRGNQSKITKPIPTEFPPGNLLFQFLPGAGKGSNELVRWEFISATVQMKIAGCK